MPKTPDALAPSWIRPLCVQREIGRGIAARLRWMREHPDQGTFLYPIDSMPVWTEEGWTPYEHAALRRWSDEWLVIHFLIEVERLLRLVQVPPTLMGEEVWTRAVLGSCQHLAQVYHKFRRRYKARKVRRFVREALLDYIYWEPKATPETADAEVLAPAAAN